MRLRSIFVSTFVAAAFVTPVSAVQAVSIPPNPGDFIVAMQPGGPTPGQMPDCDPELTSIGALFMAGQTSVSATCTMKSTTTSSTITGTASNPTLAASTGDAGFSQGTITARCNSSQLVNLQMTITMSGSTMNSFAGTVFQACTFSMVFADASKSQLLGTIELNGKLGSEDGTVVKNTIKISIDAKVFVTGGTGAFSGYSGGGTFNQSQEINIDPNNQGGGTTVEQPQAVKDFCAAKGISNCTQQGIGAWCLANQGPQAADCISIMPQVKSASVSKSSVRASAASDNNTMALTLKKSSGVARIIAPAPPVGSPTAAAKVKATTAVKVVAPSGSTCTVKSNIGKKVGVGKVSGKYGAVTIKPVGGAYVGASTIVATCKTKAGKTITSNKVKVKR